MIREIILGNKKIRYEFTIKNVKNINLRIKPNGQISVSANICIPDFVVDEFLKSKKDFILNALKGVEEMRPKVKKEYFSEEEVKRVITAICEKVYPVFKKFVPKFPEIRFKYMVSMWGSCNPKKRILTFNINLKYAPYECIEYVVLHEFTHFIQQNHSRAFYEELKKTCPDWKIYRGKLKEIDIR